jgi:flagellar export protein FliJ
MKAFRFRLEQVLSWRRTELDLEESRLKQMHAAVVALDRERTELESARDDAGRSLLARAAVYGADLQLLASYRDAVKRQSARLERRRTERLKEIAAQKEKLMEARRRFRLLEKLRERRLAEWRYESARQAEAELPACGRPKVPH